MASTITSNYVGERAGEILRPVLLGGDTLANSLVTIHEGLKYKGYIPILTVDDDIIQASACDWNATGTSATVERTLTIYKRMINMPICKQEFLDTWFQPTGSLGSLGVNNEWVDAWLSQIGARIAENEEFHIWQGNFEASSYTDFNGLLKQADDASGTIKVNISALTSSNVIAQIRLAIAEMTAAMTGNYDFEVFVNKKTAQLYRQANSNDFNNLIYTGTMPLNIDGYTMRVAPGIPDDVVCIAKKSDLHYGCDLVNDSTMINVVDTTETLNDLNVRFAAHWGSSTQVTNQSQIVLAGVVIES